MTKEELLNELLTRGHIVQLGENNFIISNKLERDTVFGTPDIVRVDPKTTPGCFKSEEIELSSPSDLLKKFIKDSRIPFRAKTSIGGFYQLAAESDYARKYLYNVLVTKQYKYEDITAATAMYYNNDKMARVTLTNFFKQGVFDQVMTEFLANPQSSTIIGTVGPKVNKVSL